MIKKLIIMTLFSFSMTGLYSQNLRQTYKNVCKDGVARTSQLSADIIKEQDLVRLPALLQKYLRLAGVVGQERVNNVKIVFKGRMRSNPDDPWMNFTSEQFNFFDKSTRAFYIRANKMGIPANGLHLYKNEKAFMKIKLAGIFKIIDVSGQEMNQSETVTFFNDICFFAPAVLVDLQNVTWEPTDPYKLKANYSAGSQSISAELTFNDDGWLIDFISNDRYEIIGGKSYQRPWYTPVYKFGTFGNKTLPKQASAWYKRPEQDFCYGEFNTIEVEYNCKTVK